jgi:hypothetical protein
MKWGSNDVGKSLDQAGPELGGEMDDATFLKQCGIEVDMRWLLEISNQNETGDVSTNYAKSLLRVANTLDRANS